MILLTNDDGPSRGIGILSSVARKFDRVTEIIPSHQQSAVAKSMTFHKALRLREHDFGGRKAFILSGTPADCVCFALHNRKILRQKPSLVLSGINAGDNASLHSIFTSGTLGSCMEGALFGIPSIAFSMEMLHRDWSHPENWRNEKQVGKIIESIIAKVIKKGMPAGCEIIAVNFPKNLAANPKLTVCKPRRHHFNIEVIRRVDPNEMPYYWVVGKGTAKGSANDDVGQLHSKGNITITPISLSLSTDGACASLKKMFG